MPDGRSDTTRFDAGNGEEPSIESLLGEYIDRLNRGETPSPEEIIANHPDHAADLLREIESFQALSPVASSGKPLGTLGDYQLLRKVGRGGMGVVYEAWETSMDRRVALKVLP